MLKANTSCFGKKVSITRSGETGTVTGFCIHQRSKGKQFFVEYTAGDGRAVDGWFFEDQLTML
jgi:hypothetical protein